ncbi:MAG: lipoprotein-releasing ABC transporter ATP-binding protein LolD [Gammaproteobacteria bacterium]|nr:lipoprotein-releasing ABC transporter ATP-binding protein LolD [Gammaproteobacteria bacterium]MBI5618856.1 lipoprotein-releasing ABC transporter ATP-binding protein LolD [Gammaproteobacteria bacterium]
MSDSVIVARELTKTFHDGVLNVAVLNGVDFTLAAGESVAIVGASGSGKSTLLHLLGGLDVPTTGSVTIAGRDIARLNEVERGLLRNRALGFVYQFHHLLPEFTALENVAMPLLIGGVAVTEARGRASDMLAKVGLATRLGHRPAELSGGERQRAAIARALVTAPQCVLADEPTGNLDERTAQVTLETMLALKQEFRTGLVLVTHDRGIAARMDRIVHLHDGRLAAGMPA